MHDRQHRGLRLESSRWQNERFVLLMKLYFTQPVPQQEHRVAFTINITINKDTPVPILLYYEAPSRLCGCTHSVLSPPTLLSVLSLFDLNGMTRDTRTQPKEC